MTNQITRNTIGGPVVYGDRKDDSADYEVEPKVAPVQPQPQPQRHGSAAVAPASANSPASVLLSVEPLEGEATRRQQKQQLSSQLSAGANRAGQTDGRSDKLSAIGSEVVITEDEDDARVYVTNATNKPFRIAALGGYDPEADFRDAAEELDSLADSPGGRARGSGAARRGDADNASKSNAPGNRGDEGDDDEESESSKVARRVEPSVPETPYPGMYEDASETDEVTFGQDDPYQTDLEAEMRAQQYDLVGKFAIDSNRADGRPSAALASTQAERNLEQGGESNESKSFNNDDGKSSPEEDEADIENDYRRFKPEARADRVPVGRPGERRDEDRDEGQWVNDGADEMDIPSQSHQNFILDKAARHDAQVRKAAEEEMEAKKQPAPEQEPDGEQAQSDGEQSQRMPNADYLENQPFGDDSSYNA